MIQPQNIKIQKIKLTSVFFLNLFLYITLHICKIWWRLVNEIPLFSRVKDFQGMLEPFGAI